MEEGGGAEAGRGVGVYEGHLRRRVCLRGILLPEKSCPRSLTLQTPWATRWKQGMMWRTHGCSLVSWGSYEAYQLTVGFQYDAMP